MCVRHFEVVPKQSLDDLWHKFEPPLYQPTIEIGILTQGSLAHAHTRTYLGNIVKQERAATTSKILAENGAAGHIPADDHRRIRALFGRTIVSEFRLRPKSAENEAKRGAPAAARRRGLWLSKRAHNRYTPARPRAKLPCRGRTLTSVCVVFLSTTLPVCCFSQ